ncbi:MAG: metal-dependent transcriptional regulator, partial [Terrimesophilobacter sp.]
RISERLGHSGPTVSQTIARMERDGLVVVEDDRHLRLTATGRSKAVTVMRRHRLAERLLADVIGLDWALVHDEACRWEHVMSEQVERRLLELLEHPTHSPYGNPIPGLDELGDTAKAAKFSDGVVNLVNLVLGAVGPVKGVIRRLGEPVQYEPELLEQLQGAGLVPGAKGSFASRGDYVLATVDGGDNEGLELPVEVAQHIYVGTSRFAD